MSIQFKLALAVALLALGAGTSYGQNPDAQYVAGDTLWMRPQLGVMGIAENGTKLMIGLYPDIGFVDPATGDELYRIEAIESRHTVHDPNLRFACFNSYGPNKQGWIWKVYNLDERRMIYEKYTPDDRKIVGVAIAHDRIVVSGGGKGSILISMSSGDTIATLRGVALRVDDETGKAYMMDNSVLDIVNLADGRVENTFSTPAAVGPRQFTVTKDGKHVIYTLRLTDYNSIIAIDVTTGTFKDISSVLGSNKGYWCCTDAGMFLQRDEEGRYVYLSGMYSPIDLSAVVLRFDQQTLKEDVILYSSIVQQKYVDDAYGVMVDAKRQNLIYTSKAQNQPLNTVCRSLSPVSSVAAGTLESQRMHIETDATQLTVYFEIVDADGQVRVDLYDMQGRRVREMVLSADGRASAPTTDLVPGSYVVACDIHGQRHSHSIVISR
jgi:hypothetical protein